MSIRWLITTGFENYLPDQSKEQHVGKMALLLFRINATPFEAHQSVLSEGADFMAENDPLLHV